MSTQTPPIPTTPTRGVDTVDAPVRIECAEIWGGNHTIYAPVALPGLHGVLYSRPCSGGRGGDLHYLSICGSGLLSRICIADVVGHGETVAKVGSAAYTLVRRSVDRPDQRRMFSALNDLLVERGLSVLTTAAAFTYYPPTQRLSYSYAGHPPAWHYERASRTWQRLELDRPPGLPDDQLVNCPFAISTSTMFTRHRMRLELGDRFIVVTDGVLEAPDPDGKLFGADRLTALLESITGQRPDADPEAIGAALVDALNAHRQIETFDHDDVTFLVMEVTAAPRGPALWHVLRNRVLRRLTGRGKRAR